nr:hypothetical protein [Victivallaceae bacterium]
PAAWNMPDIDLTTDPQLYVLEIAQVGTSIFVAVKYPDISDGNNATIEVGTVTTGEAGSSASVSNSGTETAAIFDFTIPKGDTGAAGATGATGADGEDGDSAYDLWIAAGNSGTMDDFLQYTEGKRAQVIQITSGDLSGNYLYITADHMGKVLEFYNTDYAAVYIQHDSVLELPVGSVFVVDRLGTGAVDINGAYTPSAVQINGENLPTGARMIAQQYTGVTLRKIAANSWLVQGSIL